MTIAHYLDLRQIFEQVPLRHEANRVLGLETEQKEPLERVELWRVRHLPKIEGSRWSRAYERYRYGIGLVLGVVAFVLGVLTGAGLLSYSGKEPVNVIYFLAVAVMLPLVSMVLSLLAMIRASHTNNALVHLSPASWLEKIVQLFRHRDPPPVSLPVSAANWLVILHSQRMAFWFSLGLLLALAGTVATRDIAFAWSTTLRITPEAFHRFVEAVAWPWHRWFPSAVPSLELITRSQYFRLGGVLETTLVDHAAQLGAWWRFLAMATLVYAVGLRLVMWGVAKIGLARAVTRAVMTMPEVRQLLHDMATPIIQTQAEPSEHTFVSGTTVYSRVLRGQLSAVDQAIGWGIERQMLQVILDAQGVPADSMETAGGNRTLAEDAALIAATSGRVLLVVKSWEPPTMEWVDFLVDLLDRTDQITVFPVGTREHDFVPEEGHRKIWERKLAELDLAKVWIWIR